jgi:hypothetical protein
VTKFESGDLRLSFWHLRRTKRPTFIVQAEVLIASGDPARCPRRTFRRLAKALLHASTVPDASHLLRQNMKSATEPGSRTTRLRSDGPD